MAFDAELAQRVREGLLAVSGALPDEKRMFGGLCFMIAGNMCCGILGDRLMARVGPDAYATLLGEPGANEMDFTGRPMRGMVYVTADGIASDEDLADWIARGVAYARSLPPK